MNFQFGVPSDIIFHNGSSKEAANVASSMGCRKILCVYDIGIQNAGIIEPILNTFKESNIEVIEFDGVVPDPTVEVVLQATELAKKHQIDGIVAIGGGSSLDTAKAVNILLTNEGELADFEGINLVKKPGKPLILIPTTSGTGSEVTVASVITDSENSRKMAFIGQNVGGHVAIIDPLLTIGLPVHISVATGMDAFSHAVEAFTTTIGNPLTDALATQAITLIYENLPKVVQNPTDITARSNMSLASMIAGIAFSNAFVHLGHGLAHAMGAKWHIPHGVACAIALPYALQHNKETIPDKIVQIGKVMGLAGIGKMNEAEATQSVINAISALNVAVNMPTLKSLEVDEALIDEVCDLTMKDIVIGFSHKPVDRNSVKAILKDACKA
ncbi:iron-containing alcohol dehydrogenase family protein [Vibrio parahaemolyticus]|uniref:iron-containing alcohol dehydrogenase family protein n=1 Tax=Vibrio mediterranei TaxID=689 RepID=UPI0040697BB6